ncbi:related to leukotriene-a4 hydrolase [Ceraceosorus bombacis]|uniref:Related to leukotriene-a4 hydrolase n=1 Tax=Ceraceosorus bombacis TaxID=401625 RepID=A0A0P1BNR4_9BASI|nr:related to leukotriene-a4 hydrolase [Ceraceosorus bombacis]
MSASSWVPPAPGSIPPPPRPPFTDQHTLSNLADIRTLNLHLEWHVDWDAKLISGSAAHELEVIGEKGTDRLVLDTSYIDIHKVEVEGRETKDWHLAPRKGSLGAALTVPLGKVWSQGSKGRVVVHYSTTDQCTALGWLTAAQTEGKKSPLVFSQAQAIHARSLVPIQDTPSHKIKYTARVKSKIPILMSALPAGSVQASEDHPGDPLAAESQGLSDDEEKYYVFKQPVGIPSYLIGIVGGDFVFRSLGPRCGVWAEPPMADRAEWEFKSTTHKYLLAAEELISPYSWTRFDSVVLPPSFPYGGMEQPNLVLLTPTLVCGDRSQCDVVLHELSHFWSGNLTSCATWADFWLNEGINVWIERLILQKIHGPEVGPAYRGLSYLIGEKELGGAYKEFDATPRFKRLVPKYSGNEDPDDAFSRIPYEAGSNLILYLERLVGGLDIFIPFIRSWFATFYDRSVTTGEFRQHLADFFAGNEHVTNKLKEVDWDAWLNSESGKLPVQQTYDDRFAKQSYALADRWLKVIKEGGKAEGFSKKDIEGWSVDQQVVFLEQLHLGPKVKASIAEQLDQTYQFSQAQCGEILLSFFVIALEDPATQYAKQCAEWVKTVGRMKYARQLYRALYAVDPDFARKTFEESKSFYHPICRNLLRQDLKLAPVA